jgi:hypothetical protein
MKDQDLDALSRQARVAVAAACLERALDFYRNGNFSYRVRNAPGGVLKAPPDDDLPEHALSLAWTFAETGQIDPQAPDAVIAALNSDADDAAPEDMVMAGKTVTDSVCDLMRTISDETPAKAKRTTRGAICAIWDGVAAVAKRPEAERAETDEDALQQRILARAQNLAGSPLTRKDFADLIAEPVAWHGHMARYRKTYKHG